MSYTKSTVAIAAALLLTSAPLAFAETGTTLGGASKDNSASGGSETSGTNADSSAKSSMTKSDGNNVKSGDQGKGTSDAGGMQK